MEEVEIDDEEPVEVDPSIGAIAEDGVIVELLGMLLLITGVTEM